MNVRGNGMWGEGVGPVFFYDPELPVRSFLRILSKWIDLFLKLPGRGAIFFQNLQQQIR